MTDVDELGRAELSGLDPYALQDVESARIDAFLTTLDDDGWLAPTGCSAWDRRDLVAHLAAVEEYHQRGLDDTLGELFGRLVAAGATDLDSFNDVAVQERADKGPAELLEEWRTANRSTRQGFRERGEAPMTTSIGPYPARWQAFHAAGELATHADDLGAPVTAEEAAARTAWLVRLWRFALAEAKSELSVSAVPGGTRISGMDIEVELDDTTFVRAVSGRTLPEDGLDESTRAVLAMG